MLMYSHLQSYISTSNYFHLPKVWPQRHLWNVSQLYIPPNLAQLTSQAARVSVLVESYTTLLLAVA